MHKDFQVNIPIFVRSRYKPLTWKGKTYQYNEQIPWQELSVPEESVRIWYRNDLVYHNPELEKQAKVGDRLEELSGVKLETLYRLLNAELKSRVVNKTEYNKKKVKFSKLDNKQRALIRQWLYNNAWASEIFYDLRESILAGTNQEVEVEQDDDETDQE